MQQAIALRQSILSAENQRGCRLVRPQTKWGRVAGTNIAGGSARFPGVLGTTIVKAFDLACGENGAQGNRKLPLRDSIPFL